VKEYGGTRIEYHPDSGGTKFLVATEQGVTFLANKKKNDVDIQQKYGINWGRHLGPVTGIQRCPSQPKFILTVGDWTARVKI
jgi:dynein intermediate chain 2